MPENEEEKHRKKIWASGPKDFRLGDEKLRF